MINLSIFHHISFPKKTLRTFRFQSIFWKGWNWMSTLIECMYSYASMDMTLRSFMMAEIYPNHPFGSKSSRDAAKPRNILHKLHHTVRKDVTLLLAWQVQRSTQSREMKLGCARWWQICQVPRGKTSVLTCIQGFWDDGMGLQPARLPRSLRYFVSTLVVLDNCIFESTNVQYTDLVVPAAQVSNYRRLEITLRFGMQHGNKISRDSRHENRRVRQNSFQVRCYHFDSWI